MDKILPGISVSERERERVFMRDHSDPDEGGSSQESGSGSDSASSVVKGSKRRKLKVGGKRGAGCRNSTQPNMEEPSPPSHGASCSSRPGLQLRSRYLNMGQRSRDGRGRGRMGWKSKRRASGTRTKR